MFFKKNIFCHLTITFHRKVCNELTETFLFLYTFKSHAERRLSFPTAEFLHFQKKLKCIVEIRLLFYIRIYQGFSVSLNLLTLTERVIFTGLVHLRSKWAIFGPRCKMSLNACVACVTVLRIRREMDQYAEIYLLYVQVLGQ